METPKERFLKAREEMYQALREYIKDLPCVSRQTGVYAHNTCKLEGDEGSRCIIWFERQSCLNCPYYQKSNNN